MFEKFTEGAIKVIMLSQEEARRMGHNFVGTEQLLLGVIGQRHGIGARALKKLKVTLKKARKEIELYIGRGTGFVASEIPFTPRAKRVFQIIDHASIFLLIAGTYTPFLLVGLKNSWRWILLAIVWGLALLGVSFKALCFDRFQKLSVLAYILMGWLGVVGLKELLVNIPLGGLIWLAVGGVVYTVGVIFYALKRTRYAHAIWHAFVLGGSICHYLAVLLYLAPAR